MSLVTLIFGSIAIASGCITIMSALGYQVSISRSGTRLEKAPSCATTPEVKEIVIEVCGKQKK